MTWNPIKTYRIDFLLFTLFSVFFVPLFVVVIWFSYDYTSKELASNTSYYQQALLEEIHKQLILQRESIEQMSLAFSRNEALTQFLSLQTGGYDRYMKQLAIESMLAQITYSSSNVESVDIFMENSPVGTRDFAVRILDMRQLQDEEWFDRLRADGFVWIGEREIETKQGKPSVISFARTVDSAFGEILGVLMIHVKADEIHNVIWNEAADASSQRYLVDSSGMPIVKANGDVYPVEQIREHTHYFQQPSGHSMISGIDTKGSKRTDFLIVWSQLPQSDWILVEITDWKVITKGSLKLSMYLVLMGGIAVFIALFFILYISGQFTKPISLLVKEMRKFTGNSTNVTLPTEYTNEFGALFQGYRRLNDKIMELYQSLEEQYERQKESELKALQSMINPHFLYNTLDQINWMAIEKGQGEISHILELMGKMFRIGLSKGNTFITIREELMLVSCYIEIQQIRWGEGLRFHIDVPDELYAYTIPKMTLQPFIENSILHGFHGRTEGYIEIRVKLDDGSLMISIRDNGRGLQDGWKFQHKETGGYGTRNVMERIDSYFGAPYGVDIMNHEQAGTVVFIRLPALKQATA